MRTAFADEITKLAVNNEKVVLNRPGFAGGSNS